MSKYILYTYQFSPLQKKTESNMFESNKEVLTQDELMVQKQDIFGAFFRETFTPLFKKQNKKFDHKIILNENNIIVFRLANNKKLYLEESFHKQEYRYSPSCLIIIDNRKDVQRIAIEEDKVAFSDTNAVKQILLFSFKRYLNNKGLDITIQRDYEQVEFWNIIHTYKQKIEMVRFHSIIWPAILTALDLPLPKKVYGHGWLLFDGGKMSKSTGNVVDPLVLADRFGVDAIRVYLLRDVPFGQDGIYTNELLIKRINSDLVNTLGNLIKRTAAMIGQYFDGVIPSPDKTEAVDDELKQFALSTVKAVDEEMNKFDTSKALTHIFDLLGRANKYIDETAPWVLNKEGNTQRLKTVMFNLSEAIRFAAVLLTPFLPQTPSKIYKSFPFDESQKTLDSLKTFGSKKTAGVKVEQNEALYARLDVQKVLKEMETLAAAAKEENNKSNSNSDGKDKKEVKTANGDKIEGTADINQISIEDFTKVELKVGEILTAEKVENADKLLKFSVKVGEETRTIVSGIAKYYSPEELIGKEVVVVANLKPAKLKGIMSEGMLLCAVDGDKVVLITPMVKVNSGSKVC